MAASAGGGVVGSGTPDGQCLQWSDTWREVTNFIEYLPVVAVRLAARAARLDGILCDNGRSSHEEEDG